ncbi:MAG: HAD-IA family hydrolase [Nitrospirota bacterium]
MNLIGLDLDGTLEDSRADMVAVARRVRAQLGLPPRPDEALRPWVNKGMEQLYRACFDDYITGDGARLGTVRLRYEADYFDHVAVETKLYPGVAPAVEQLAAFGSLACVTNKPERISWRLLEVLGISKHFTTVVGGDTCPRTKPDPIVLEAAARRCGFEKKPARTFMIGDTAADIAMGRAFGATTIWCAWGYTAEPDGTADYVAERPEQLPQLVRAP